MPNVKRIEGGTSKPYSDLEPTQTLEKNLGFISNNTVTHLGGPMSYKQMQENFTFIAPIVAADVKTWEDRNVKNRGTKLNPIDEQIKFAQSYTKKLDAYNKALQSQSNKSKDRGGKGTLEPSKDFAGTREFPGELIQNKAKKNKKKYIS